MTLFLGVGVPFALSGVEGSARAEQGEAARWVTGCGLDFL